MDGAPSAIVLLTVRALRTEIPPPHPTVRSASLPPSIAGSEHRNCTCCALWSVSSIPGNSGGTCSRHDYGPGCGKSLCHNHWSGSDRLEPTESESSIQFGGNVHRALL